MRRPRPKFKVSFYLYFCCFWINATQINFESIKRKIQRIISDSCFQLKLWFNVDARAPSIPLLNFPFKTKSHTKCHWEFRSKGQERATQRSFDFHLHITQKNMKTYKRILKTWPDPKPTHFTIIKEMSKIISLYLALTPDQYNFRFNSTIPTPETRLKVIFLTTWSNFTFVRGSLSFSLFSHCPS